MVELDRSWIGTPFDFQGFPLTEDDQINALKVYCKYVYVDPEREVWAPTRRVAGARPVRGSVVYKELTPVETEVVVAREIYKRARRLHHSLENLRIEGEIDGEKLTGRSQHDGEHPAQPRCDDAAQHAARERPL